MFRRILFILALPFAALIAFSTGALAATCIPAGTYSTGFITIDDTQAPSGAHISSGTPSCTVGPNTSLGSDSITCASFSIGGVGHTNADVTLVGNYTATVDCFNKSGKLVESHTSTITPTSETTVTSTKNGQLFVPQEIVNPASVPQTCPNSLWTPQIRAGTLCLTSFTETVTFAGFTEPYFKLAVSASQLP